MLPLLVQFLLFCGLSLVGVFSLAVSRANFFRRRGITGPTPALFSGNLASVFGVRPGILRVAEWTKQLGTRLYGIMFGWVPMLIVADADLAHEVLVDKFEQFPGRNLCPMVGDVDKDKLVHLFFAQGPRWKRLRSITNPAFSTANIKKIMPIMDDSIQITVEHLDKDRQHSRALNLQKYFVEMTFDVIARVAMGQPDSRQFRSELTQLAGGALQRANNNAFDWYAWICPPLGRKVLKPLAMLSGVWRKDPGEVLTLTIAEAVMKRKAERELDARRGTVHERHQTDFIDLFLDVEADQQVQPVESGKTAMQRVSKTNCLEEVVMQCILFLLAGFDTTANSLSVLCHYLALYPEVQRKLQEEIDTVCGDETPSYEQLSQLRYAEAVIKETLRMSPIAGGVNRICSEQTTLGECTVEPGTAVQLDVWTIHKSKLVWGEDAELFRPERWLGEDGRLLPLPHFYGFGGGPRICIGMRFALLEEKMALTRILRRFTIVRRPETEEKLEFTGQVVLNPIAVTVGLEPREDCC